jgi:hypothetical protein
MAAVKYYAVGLPAAVVTRKAEGWLMFLDARDWRRPSRLRTRTRSWNATWTASGGSRMGSRRV